MSEARDLFGHVDKKSVAIRFGLTRLLGFDLLPRLEYATAIRAGTASTEASLRRFTRRATHPTYHAMLEVGRAQKTIFLCRYRRDGDLQREINSGLNVAESWNRANAEIFHGKPATSPPTAATSRK